MPRHSQHLLSLPQACACRPQTGCDLAKFKTNKMVMSALNVTKDPIGLAVEAKGKDTPVQSLLQAYATAHKCSLYSLSMQDLVKGLLKGSNLPLGGGVPGGKEVGKGESAKGGKSLSRMGNNQNKVLLVAPDKAANCNYYLVTTQAFNVDKVREAVCHYISKNKCYVYWGNVINITMIADKVAPRFLLDVTPHYMLSPIIRCNTYKK